MKVTVVGTGYVGLVTGACLAQVGNQVLCVDVDADKVARLQTGDVPIHEPDLPAMVQEGIAGGRLRFTTEVAEGITHGDFLFIAVGTPPDEDGSADLRHVLAVAGDIGRHLQRPVTVINKSTVPVGTAQKVRARIAAVLQDRAADIVFDVVSNPEFLKEGAAVADFMKPDRIIIGVDNVAAAERMRVLYAPFNRNHDRLIIMDPPSAELTKYAANVMLATKISLMNELAGLAERMGADIEQVRRGIGADPRIGYAFIYPGCGYGGSCFPKDVRALEYSARQYDFDAPLLAAVEKVNDRQKGLLEQKVVRALGEDLTGKTIAVWGLAFKPNTDDMREAPSRVLMEALWRRGAQVQAYDPVAMEEARRIYGGEPALRLCSDPYMACEGAEALVICTEWQQFRSPDFVRMRSLLRQPLIVDGRNIYDPAVVRAEGFAYHAIGRP
ncbi:MULTISPECIES: UDP-glucose dehydrogenase family protein [Acidithiobacillus]|jgi:UDPglucose 6-dehydrogenase|uniref:UDP-glucose 6-dehydrogenase n=2 Tax=Acidithiobacillus ferrooxidans TaxID=920 RepID=B7J9K6_ACIF2|nr:MULTISPECIES: UDP-glucose/GDP-mannose dehydrogenase family protein [Acidithiobacillus]MCL5956302.1 UDP-glucose/GDP-mannose dehydrogenase family protein [Gammaproteobacteria bacterium]ACK80446.1 UDP-glucose 6-dehydrogenase [Acidithiobacillus ferrooxidans ATCC 23270]MBN6744270.1 UDP-glucose/GDP-mannose dehydrogenase family protein [Acidithiobacillus sp. MC2.2]MBN6747229.1 UDP-glucose/GDP-mannose dehydrogenase family protein [Acidithiobacillus sp. PG05]MBU2775039.1 UDP-glucose/GDP-mannose dehy